jgi:hypothetical protein
VKWKGSGNDENTWELLSYLTNAQGMLAQYHRLAKTPRQQRKSLSFFRSTKEVSLSFVLHYGQETNLPEHSQAELPPTQEEQVPANPPSRKRELDSDDDAEPRTKRARMTRPTSEPARLTRQNLARLNKMGNNHKGSKEGSAHRDSTDDSSTTKTLSTTASGFAIQARNNGILDPISSKPPTNLEDIRERLARSRQTASPPESVYGRYARIVATARNEATMVFEVGGKLLKEYDDEGYHRKFNQAFTGYPKKRWLQPWPLCSAARLCRGT